MTFSVFLQKLISIAYFLFHLQHLVYILEINHFFITMLYAILLQGRVGELGPRGPQGIPGCNGTKVGLLFFIIHDGVMIWHHDMERCSVLLALCERNTLQTRKGNEI